MLVELGFHIKCFDILTKHLGITLFKEVTVAPTKWIVIQLLFYFEYRIHGIFCSI